MVIKRCEYMETILFKGKVNKGISGYTNIATKDPRIESLRGKIITLQITAIEEVTEKPGATITETKKIALQTQNGDING